MSPAQVAELVAGGLIRAGAHTANHVHLPLLDRAQGLDRRRVILLRREQRQLRRLRGELARRSGDVATAGRLQAESLETSAELGNRQGVAASLEELALVARSAGDDVRAVRLLAAADTLRRRILTPLSAEGASL